MTQATATREEPLWGPSGLAPAIVQDASDGRVLMLAWMDAESWRVTHDTGVVHFHSRSRDRLWRKGETSGHELRLRDVSLDCDADAILLTVDPIGPTCHLGSRSCFDAEGSPRASRTPSRSRANATPDPSPAAVGQEAGFAWLETLWSTISSRAAERPEGSYTTRLLDGGVDVAGRKVTEEATEVLIAAKDDAAMQALGADRSETHAALAGESADLLYHALVLLAERGVPPSEVIDVLRTRHGA